MSLTDLVSRPDVQEKFKAVIKLPDLMVRHEIRAAPLTKNYSLVGTAFDYLLRFHLKKRFPFAADSHWVAYNALHLPELRKNRKLYRRIWRHIQEAKYRYDLFLEGIRFSDDLQRSCLILAQIDVLFRRGALVPDFECVDQQDIYDLNNLIELVPPDVLKAERVCLLNPTFGTASQLVCGADCDLIMDDTLIDIKTTIRSRFERMHLNQVIGYYLLSRIGEISNAPEGHTIHTVGLYSARYGHLFQFSIEELIESSMLEELTTWFSNRAAQEKQRDQKKQTDPS